MATTTPVMAVTMYGVFHFGMHFGELLRKQAVARHDEEDAGLAEQQDQDDRRQGEDRGIAEHVADRAEADLAQDVGQRLVRADQGSLVGGHGALAGELFRPGREGNAARAHDRLAADGADRAGGDEDVEDGAEQQAADQADRHVALRVLGFLGGGRDRVEADIGEEDRRRRADRADPGAEAAEHAGGKERVEVGGVDRRAG